MARTAACRSRERTIAVHVYLDQQREEPGALAAERCHQSMKGSAANTRAASTSSLTLIRSSV